MLPISVGIFGDFGCIIAARRSRSWDSNCTFSACRASNRGATVAVERRKTLALLAYLAVAGRAHGREALITLLWPDLDAARAAPSFATLSLTCSAPSAKAGWTPKAIR